jgi:transposase
MPHFQGIAVHDGWPQYRSYTQATHALCNAHHLRELLGVIEQHTDGRQSWANHMNALLRALHEEVNAAEAAGKDSLDPVVAACYRVAYEQIVALGYQQNPPPTVRTAKRGPIGRSTSANLLRRLDEQREQVPRFAHDFQIPLDNNLVERDIPRIKIHREDLRQLAHHRRRRQLPGTTRPHQHDPQAEPRHPRRPRPTRQAPTQATSHS